VTKLLAPDKHLCLNQKYFNLTPIKMSDPLIRCIHILRILPRYPRGLSVKKIVDKLSADSQFETVTERTIQRNMIILEGLFHGDITKNSQKEWCWRTNAATISIPGLTILQALTFNLANSYLSSLLPSSTVNELQPFFEQANAKLNQYPNDNIVNWKKKVAIIQQTQTTLAPDINPEVHALVSHALIYDQQIELNYLHLDDNESKYVLNPIGLVLRNGITYLISEKPENNEVLILSLHRIKEAKNLGRGFKRQKDFDLQKYIKNQHLSIGNIYTNNQSSKVTQSLKDKSIKVKLKFSKDLFKYISETPLSEDQVTTIHNDHIEVSATVQYSEQLIFWLRSYGPDVEVIEPGQLRDRLIEDIEQLNRKYKIS